MTAGALKSLAVRNFQSHADTKVHFSSGINAFVGPSDKGKSATLRALLWAVDNRPSGDAIVSHWAKDEKGNIIDPCTVEIESDAGALRRIKMKGRNGYDVNGVKFDALRTGVPPAVESFFGLESVNVQRQLDPPFLLAESGGARSRFFNQLIRLEEIDEALSAAESKRRANAAAILPIQAGIVSAEAGIDALSGLASAQEAEQSLLQDEQAAQRAEARRDGILAVLGALTAARESVLRFAPLDGAEESFGILSEDAAALGRVSKRFNGISDLLARLAEARKTLAALPFLPEIEDIIARQALESEELRAQQQRHARLTAALRSGDDARKTVALADPTPLEESLGRLDKLIGALTRFRDRRDGLLALVQDLDGKRRKLPYIDKEIEDLEASLPETCPSCGASMKGTPHGEDLLA